MTGNEAEWSLMLECSQDRDGSTHLLACGWEKRGKRGEKRKIMAVRV